MQRARILKDWVATLLPAVLLGSVALFRSSANPHSISELFVGHVAPDFKLKDLDAQDVQLSSFKGKIVILDFWASWCGPCREEIPTLRRIAKEFANNDVVVIGVNSEEPADLVRSFAIKNKLTYRVVLTKDDPGVLAAYGAQALPTVVVIDKNGVIAAYHVGENERSEDVLFADIHYVAGSKYVPPQPKTAQMPQFTLATQTPGAVSPAVAPDANWQPRTADEFLARGYARLRLHKNADARADAEETLKLRPDCSMAIFLRGRASYEQKDYAAAIADFDEVIGRQPGWPEGYHYRGLAYSYSGQHEKAVPDYEKLIELSPYLPSGYNDLGWALREMGELERARTNLDKAIELEPDYIRARENRAILFDKQNDRTAERSDLTIILAIAPNNQWANDANEALLQNKQPPASAQKQAVPETIAADTPPKVISKIEPEYSDEARQAHLSGATILCSLLINAQGVPENIRVIRGAGFGLDDNAIQAVSTWRFTPATRQGVPVVQTAQIEVNFHLLQQGNENQIASLNFTLPPGATRPVLVRGHIPENPKDGTDARVRVALSVAQNGKVQNISILETTSAEWAENVTKEIQGWRFHAANVNGNPVAVQGVFEIAHSSSGRPTLPAQPGHAPPASSAPTGSDPNWQPKTADEFLARGYARLRIRKYPQAAADAEDALRLVPNSLMAEYLHGRASYDQKDYSTAIEDFSKVIQQRPDWADPYRYRGLAYSYSGQHQRALSDYQRAIELNPYEPHAYNALGWACSDLGEWQQAKANLDKAIELEPDFALARENRAKLFGKTGQLEAEQHELTILLGLFPTNKWAKDTQEAILQKQGGQPKGGSEDNGARVKNRPGT